tara:strand:- start:31 stop:174 length:144 start_codon:yes stop_codon:yes gene_type:complete
MLDYKKTEKASAYPEDWLVSKREAREMERIDDEMRLKVKEVLEKLKE